ncbi:DNA-binding MarR family transcriptional regulator/GNAT superfamily N-acetyltransferase [Actinoplanes lutulentus]|uniref:MarR family transcriptional regulator with acetyltransferase activity n=1 Tax=Actinoplanes lutulentus TaxID=1287878 RepID=A0A327Z5E5_9ACTN|nr:bifunctional helix-turn-helix transcriptional regulator/GNAT family N-acetyltransferase [Actinoplanes lutulentus]MBB2948195.1 DNA-binding MarR family transcriptional regulator/GNAT superfamily N-acetyltransferase [Actinoplanes lutulentus]RAK31305.1 MarR family transcriptional regulator with acetyltransferase activity [Actinoplanes lutulentus]
MEADQIERVRDFNRYYTGRLGLLTDNYLGQDRPLGQARLLFEIGDGCDLRDLRARLALDSGYLSRLLRGLEDQGLVTVDVHPGDGRVRVARLTDAGHRERAELDDRSRDRIAGLLHGLTRDQRDQLIAAQNQVRRLLRLATVGIEHVPAAAEPARDCLRRYAAELDDRFPEGYDAANLTPPAEMTGEQLLAYEDGRPVGCGLWTHLETDVAEIRHLWIAPEARGLGLGRLLLQHLEDGASTDGVTTVRLGTHTALTEAISLYRRSGYHEIANYSESPYNQLAFEKAL